MASPQASDRGPKPSLHESHGRTFNTEKPDYALPADEEEHSRLDIQHKMLRLKIGGLYTSPSLVQAALAPKEGRRPAVLDIGTGSGIWATEMATEFPQADVIGLDLVSPAILATQGKIPANCRFELGDANLVMDRYTGAIDVVHSRAAQVGIDDLNRHFNDIAKCLKPGGVFLLATGTTNPLNAEGEELPRVTTEGEPGFTWASKVVSTFSSFVKVTAFENSSIWLKWLEQNPNFVHPKAEVFRISTGPWKEGTPEAEIQAGRLFRDNIAEAYKALTPLLINVLKDEEAARELVRKGTEEIYNPPYERCYNWWYYTAVRGEGEWVACESQSSTV